VIGCLGAVLALYFSLIHQRGQISAIRYVSGLPPGSNVHFLTPCHSSPLRSYAHDAATSILMLECPPYKHGVPPEEYIPEDVRFFSDPVTFLRKRYSTYEWPSHFILYEDPLAAKIQGFLLDACYVEDARLFNTIASSDDRIRGDVLVFKHDVACKGR